MTQVLRKEKNTWQARVRSHLQRGLRRWSKGWQRSHSNTNDCWTTYYATWQRYRFQEANLFRF
jgi:hypothetical protein